MIVNAFVNNRKALFSYVLYTYEKGLLRYILCSIATISGGYMTQEYIYHLKEDDSNLHIFYIDYDLNDDNQIIPMVRDFEDELFNDIPVFAFGETQIKKRIKNTGDILPIVREAMKKMYAIPEIQEARDFYSKASNEDKYFKRGELLLYHMLHEYFGAQSLISKIYFRDSGGLPAHGFDAVHLNMDTRKLWLGEAKLYKDGSRAISALAKDLTEHFNTNFFDSEFTIITNRYQDEHEETPDFLKKLISPNTKTLDKLVDINIALLAGFSSDVIANVPDDVSEEYIKNRLNNELILEAEKLKKKLDSDKSSHPWEKRLNVYLLLFPVKDKQEFVRKLHEKLKGAQMWI